MSFSKQVKCELLQNKYEKSCCEKSMLYGMCIFGKSFSGFEVCVQSENENIIKLCRKLLKKYCNIKCSINTSPKGKSYSITISSKNECNKVLSTFGHSGGGSLKINHANFDCEECIKAFLAGAFLSCGTVSSPEKDYHMEFTVPFNNLAKSLVTLLEELELAPKTSVRKQYSNVIYFKDSEAIEDCLYIMGAPSSMFDMMRIEIVKDIRNRANRTANCEAANIEKTVRASLSHMLAIEKIEEKKGLDYLKPDLKAIAMLRQDNPEASLAELAKKSGLSRSGVNHRLAKIVEIANTI